MHGKESFIDLVLFAEHPLPDVDRPRVSNTDFIDDLIVAGNLVNKILVKSVALIPSISLEKLQQGILLGHMVRIYKLYDSFLLLISQNRTEMALLATRALTETSITFAYLIQSLNNVICQKFIKASLAYDKKLFDFIQSKIKDGEPLPFEAKLIEDIKNTFAKTEYDIDDINFGNDREWHADLFSLSSKVGLSELYETLYRTCSRAEHGAWYYLEFFHLTENESDYTPILENTEPHPLLLINTNLICLNAALFYSEYIQPNNTQFPLLIKN
ncbi:DUF5677 domain-containing protein [Legionella tunisiensis]|uniref:DUF5677 domain-containing protein n=1 Tax=Legionella tunisiensis TaxID=1034944 RepID=UPI0002D29BB8|nr:DUF5677 domain-containing protein [Legionella tunisiensis]